LRLNYLAYAILTIPCTHPGFGGKGANQCIIAAKLGAKVGMLTKLGKDMFGDGMRKNFIENGSS